jgi:hypothetical protein
MSYPDTRDPGTEILLADVLHPLIGRGRQIRHATFVALAVAVVLGILYYVTQPVIRTTLIEFKPMFDGADAGKYPNGLPFAVTDIVDPSIVDQVFAKNNVQTFCPRAAFQSGLSVQQSSTAIQFLTLDYQARLSDTRLTGVDRQRLQEEYASRRALAPIQYQLIFLQSPECASLAPTLVAKLLSDILETWARESEEKRGVLKIRVSMLSPAIFDQRGIAGENLLIRADLLRTAIARVITNIADVEKIPGSENIRDGAAKASFREVRAELEDLIQARLDPLVAQAGRGLGRRAAGWIEQALQAATIREAQAQQKAETYRQALREYSGVAPVPSTSRPATAGGQSSSDVQALTPQIDRTFIDRIVELSAVNTTFRQEITRQEIRAAVDAVDKAAVVAQYKELLSAVARDSASDMTPELVSRALEQLTGQAKKATQQYNDIYEEFSRVALRVGPMMYRVERPAETTTVRSFGLRNMVLLLGTVAIGFPLVLAVLLLARDHGRRLLRVRPPS